MKLELLFDDRQAQQVLHRLATSDLSRPMAAIAEQMRGSVLQNFRDGGRYDRAGSVFGGSNKWAVTSNPTPLIQMGMRGGLMGSIQARSDAYTAWVTTNKPYAAIHNYGGEQTSYARSELFTRNRDNGKFAPGTKAGQGQTYGESTRTVEARPYMVIQDLDIEDYKADLRDHLLEGLR